MVGANLPDLDVVGYPFGGQAYYLCHHRGLTHSLLGLGIESLLLAGLIVVAARLFRRQGPPVRFRGLWLAAGIGLLSHLALDSLNTYGVRPFLPFSEARFYGDMAFIVDPWLWLLFGFAACLGAPRPSQPTGSREPAAGGEGGQAELAALEEQAAAGALEAAGDSAIAALTAAEPAAPRPSWGAIREGLARVGWGAAILIGAWILFSTERAPRAVAWLWTLPFLAVLAVRHFGLVPSRVRQRFAWAGLGLACAYLALLCGLQRSADDQVRAAVESHAGAPIDVSTTHPAPAIPWRFHAIVATRATVFQASVDLFEADLSDRVRIDPGSLPRRLDDPRLEQVVGTREHHAWRSFARIPFVAELEPLPGAPFRLLLGDARYVPYPREDWCNLAASPPSGR